MSDKLKYAIIELWWVSHTALAGQSHKTYDRMIYIKDSLKKWYPQLIEGFSEKSVWLDIEVALGLNE